MQATVIFQFIGLDYMQLFIQSALERFIYYLYNLHLYLLIDLFYALCSASIRHAGIIAL